MSQTLAIIKPDAVGSGKAGKILAHLEAAGFTAKALKLTSLARAQAGAFYAVQFGVVGPIVFSLATLLFLLSMIVVGGMGPIWGPLLGAAILMLADEGMRELGDWRDIGLGLILAGFVVLLPRGLAGLRWTRTGR